MIEVLKQALEALERSVATCFDQYAHQQVMSQPNHFINQTITSLRKAIQEEALRNVQRIGQEIEQAPVSYQSTQEKSRIETVPAQGGLLPTMREGKDFTITHPPQRTEQEPVECDGDFPEGFDKSLDIPAQALRQANAALCEVTNNRMWDVPALAERMLLFCRNTHPPQRTWVGLTDEEIIDVIHPLVMADMPDEATDYEIAKAIEAKLKEKNNG